MRAIRELWNAASLAIIILLVGIVVVFVSIILDWEVPSSGAVLVCSAIVAEFVIRNLDWLHAANFVGYDPLRLQKIDEDSPTKLAQQKAFRIVKNAKFPEFIHPNATNDLEKLRAHALESDFVDFSNSNDWNIRMTSRRIERRLTWLTSISAVVGTLIWGYAHLFINACSTCIKC